MVLEIASSLFLQRTSTVSPLDIRHALERFLQSELKTPRLHCVLQGSRLDIRVATPALAEAVLVRVATLTAFAQDEFGYQLSPIRVMLE